VTDASALCCTSDITLAEFRTLKGKMDASESGATTPEEYLGGTADWRTDLYAGPSSGTLMTHAESVELFKTLRVGVTPELKSPSVDMPFELVDGTAVHTYDDVSPEADRRAREPAASARATPGCSPSCATTSTTGSPTSPSSARRRST
jgi:hypothetical protein